MKTTLSIIVLTFALAISGMSQTKPQPYTYAMVNGKIEKVYGTSKAAKTPDKIITIIGRDTIRQGAKGGLYYYAISSKTGLRYKKYIATK
jgi:hypothetical protein